VTRPGPDVVTRIKICGITSPEDARLAADAGADAIGLVLWPGSPRYVDEERARRICAELPPFVVRVGVFVDVTRERLTRAAVSLGLDVLQVHGDQPPEALSGLNRRTLKAVQVGPGFVPELALRYVGRADGILLDTRTADGARGGTGRSFDWTLASAVRQAAPYLVLAGGLNPGNVRQAIEAVRPDAVDVSSGVELSPGRKDPAAVRAFVAAVRGWA
jgi:phosphoribosylanthranilate isomerase